MALFVYVVLIGCVDLVLLGLLALWQKQRAHHLRASKQQEEQTRLLLSGIVDSSEDSIIAYSLDGTITSWNPASERFYGFTAREAIGKKIFIIVPGDRHDEVSSILERVGSGELIKSYETVRINKDGMKVHISLTVSPIKLSPHVIIGASAIARDISDQIRAEEKFQLAVESSPSGMIMVNEGGTILLANAETSRMFGYRREELVGLSVDLLLPERLRMQHGKDRRMFIANAQVRRMGEGRDLYGRRRDGTEFPIEVGLNPIYSKQGLLVLSSIIDITQRKAAEQRVRESEEHFRSLFESAPGAYLVIEPNDLSIFAVSEAYLRVTMTQREDIIGRSVFDIFPDDPNSKGPSGEQKVRASLERVKVTGIADVMPVQFYPIRRPIEQGGGFEDRWWSPINSPVFGPNKELVYIIHRVEDITTYVKEKLTKSGFDEEPSALSNETLRVESELFQRAMDLQSANESLREVHQVLERKVRERTREFEDALMKLKEVDRLKSEFLATMSHELRTPLNSIIGFTRLLMQEMAGPLTEEQQKQLAMVYGSSKHLLSLISDLLDLSRIESGRTDIELSSFYLEDVIKEALSSVSTIASTKDLKLSNDISSPLPMIRSDRKKVLQILLNLLSNAVKFTESGGVTVSAVCEGNLLKISVEDSGIGIKKESFHMLFEAFRQVDASSRRVYEGTGLGLHLSKRLVTILGGEIGVESVFGSGSRFYFTLPL